MSERSATRAWPAVPIETRGALAYRDPDTGRLVLWSSTQNPYCDPRRRRSHPRAPAEEMRVMAPDVGGGFGPKGAPYPEEALVAAAALRLGRPVKWVEGRARGLPGASATTASRCTGRGSASAATGRSRRSTTRFLADVGAYPAQGNGLTLNTVNHLPGPYRVAHYRNTGTSVVTNKTLNMAYRAAGRPEAVFVMERLMDLGARRLGLDPAEIRRRNLVRPEEMPYRPGLTYKDGVPIAYDPGDFPAAFERALDAVRLRRAGAGARRAQPAGAAAARRGHRLLRAGHRARAVRGRHGARGSDREGLRAHRRGRPGPGPRAPRSPRSAPRSWARRFDDVIVTAGDTTLFPFGMGTGGSRVMANAGPAVAQTAREVRERAALVAAEMLECAPADMRIEAAAPSWPGMPDRALPLGRLAQAAVRSKALKPTGRAGAPRLHVLLSRHRHVGVRHARRRGGGGRRDRRVQLLAYAVVHDPGRAINPAIVEGQLQGGAVQGIGGRPHGGDRLRRAGQLLTGSFMDYAIPRADDVPSIPVALTEHRSVINPLGVKGVGESGAIPGAAAIANAVEDAVADLGVIVREVPVTPARLHAWSPGRAPPRAERPARSALRTRVRQRLEGRRGVLGPPVGHDAERVDEPLPARGERDGHAEVEDLVIGEVLAKGGHEVGIH